MKWSLLYIGLFLISLSSCVDTLEEKLSSPLSPISLSPTDTTLVLLQDYFLETKEISEIKLPNAWSFDLSKEKDSLWIYSKESYQDLFLLEIQLGRQKVDMLMRGSVKKQHRIKVQDKGYNEVLLKGEMTQWQRKEGKREGDYWVFDFILDPVLYQYLLILDGKESLDPSNTLQVSNGQAGFNSLLDLRPDDKQGSTHIYASSFVGEKLEISVQGEKLEKIYPYWENQYLAPEFGAEGDIEIRIPVETKKLKRSFLRVFARTISGFTNDMLIPLEYGVPLQDASQLQRQDKEAQIMYFTLVDRFNNGDTLNDAPVQDARLMAKANFMGGDLQGITAKIKSGYFDSLHMNCLWLSPITQNVEGAFQEYPEPKNYYTGYHGYWPISSSKVDKRFGDSKALKELVRVAHQHDINVLLDFVCNHVHEQHPLYVNNPQWATDLILSDGSKNIRIWDEQRLTTWFDTFLPTLDLENDSVLTVQVDSASYWIQEYGLDGFRHDATKHIPQKFWRALTRKLKKEVIDKEQRPLYQIGETYGSRDLIASYIGSGMLDAQFDFNLYFDIRPVFALEEVSMLKLKDALEQTFSYYGYHSSMGYISGNHDIPRFISLAGGDLSFYEDDRAAGFSREVGVGDTSGYQKLQMLHAFLQAIPGVPVVFYGDEIGLPGANDPDNRKMMQFEKLNPHQESTKQMLEDLTAFRQSHLAMTYGETRIIQASDSHLVLERRYFDQIVYCVFNKSSKSTSITWPIDQKVHSIEMAFNERDYSIDQGRVKLEIPAWSFEYIKCVTDE